MAQVTAIAQTALRALSPGHDASSHHSVQRIQRSRAATGALRQRPHRAAVERLRHELHSHPVGHRAGRRRCPSPYGGKQRQVQVDIDTQKLQAYGLSAADVVNAVSAQNIILPAGDMKMGQVDYQIETNSAPAVDCGAQRPADQDGKRLDGLHSRHRQCARRLSSANQHCARRRAAGLSDHPSEDGQRLYAGHHLQCARAAAADCGATAPRAPDPAHRRPVGLRQIGHQRGAARGHHRRLPDRNHDPHLPRQLAFDPHHRGLDSTVHRQLVADARRRWARRSTS